jgi:hypothetical protein
MEYAKIYQVEEGSARREGGLNFEFGMENLSWLIVLLIYNSCTDPFHVILFCAAPPVAA